MKALILVGGYGTRLRPLTLSVPKPLIHFCNRPIIEYQIRALVQVGVKHVILAVAYRPDAMKEALVKLENKYQIKITCSVEEEPLLTAGPIRLAREFLMNDEPDEEYPQYFFTFNSDIICEFPLMDMLSYHIKHGCEGTIGITTVEDPTNFGVVVYEPPTGRVQEFVEKPKQFVGDAINAGIYLFTRTIIDRIEPRPTSIEREIFPTMARDHQLYSYKISGYWADIGRPTDFLIGTKLYLEALKFKDTRGEYLASTGKGITGNVLIHPSAEIGQDCKLGPDVTIGPGCRIAAGVRVTNSALMANVYVGPHTWMKNCIIGWNCKLGSWNRIEGITVLGQDVTIQDECFINGAFILPYKTISSSITAPGTIIM